MLDDIDRQLIQCIGGDIGESRYPYREIAAELGLSEDEVLARLQAFQAQGVFRRLGAILRHQLAGFTANGMSVWDVPDDAVAQIGARMAEYPEITHCYERPRLPEWPYNLYAMIHAASREECEAIATRIAGEVGITAYQVLYSVREFKKTSMQYFQHTAK